VIKITEGGAELIGLPTMLSRGNDHATVYSDLLCYGARPEGGTALRCGALLAKQPDAENRLLPILDCSYWAPGFNVLYAIRFDLYG